MTPATAVRLECRWCSNCKTVDCISKVCKLRDRSLSHLKRIKAHCLDCVDTRQEVKECTGKLLFEDRLCYLHPYRMGTNPKRKGIGNQKPSLKGLEFYRKQRTHDTILALGNESEALV